MTPKFGSVGHMVTDNGTDATFIIIGEHEDEFIRRGVPEYRVVMNLAGVGNQGGEPIGPGEIGAVRIDSKDIEWLDD